MSGCAKPVAEPGQRKRPFERASFQVPTTGLTAGARWSGYCPVFAFLSLSLSFVLVGGMPLGVEGLLLELDGLVEVSLELVDGELVLELLGADDIVPLELGEE